MRTSVGPSWSHGEPSHRASADSRLYWRRLVLPRSRRGARARGGTSPPHRAGRWAAFVEDVDVPGLPATPEGIAGWTVARTLVGAATLQRETGDCAAVVLDRIMQTIRERAELKRLVRGLKAGGQLRHRDRLDDPARPGRVLPGHSARLLQSPSAELVRRHLHRGGRDDGNDRVDRHPQDRRHKDLGEPWSCSH